MYERQFITTNQSRTHHRNVIRETNLSQEQHRQQQHYSLHGCYEHNYHLREHQQYQQQQQSSQEHKLNSNQHTLQPLATTVELSKAELIRITSNQDVFHHTVQKLIMQAKTLIESNKIEQALIYLNQAQKILQYAASSGKSIQRRTITTVLHNQACCYQSLWQLQKCSNYIQALIFNFNSELRFTEFTNNYVGNGRQSLSDLHAPSGKKENNLSIRLQQVRMEKKVELAKYHLLYCAINSQLKNNQCALEAARKTAELMRTVFEELLEIYEMEEQVGDKDNGGSCLNQRLPLFVGTMLREISRIGTTEPNVQKTNDLLSLTRYYIKVYNSRCVLSSLTSSKGGKGHSRELHEKYKNFSIGSVMQLQPVGCNNISIHQNNNTDAHVQHESLQRFNHNNKASRISYQKLLQKLIIFSISQFTIATELRYIAMRNAQGDKGLSFQMSEFKESQTYHLMGVLLIAMYMPFDIVYMEHIISSYHSHYQRGLVSEGFDGTAELNQDEIARIKEAVVFTQKERRLMPQSREKQVGTKKCSTTNNSNTSNAGSFHYENNEDPNKSSLNKEPIKIHENKSSLVHEEQVQTNEFERQNKLFAEYYYCKKNTEPDEKKNQEDRKNKRQMIKQVKSKKKDATGVGSSKCKKVISGNKIENKPKSKSKQSAHLSPKSSTINIYQGNHKGTTSRGKSYEMTPQMTQSPILISQACSRIVNKSTKQFKQKGSNKKADLVKAISQESEYFTKPNSIKKGTINTNKSPVSKQSCMIKKKQTLEIEKQYFNIQDPQVLWKNRKSPQKKTFVEKKKEARKQIPRENKEGLSSKSFKKNLSPNGGLSIKQRQQKNSLIYASEVIRQKRGIEKHTVSPAVLSSRGSVHQKKAQRLTVRYIDNLKSQCQNHMER